MNIIKNTLPLSKDNTYQRPKYTIQDKLTEDEIKEKLEDYIEVTDIKTVPLGSHLRYFTSIIDNKTGNVTRKFRLGGVLVNKDNADTFVILSNGSRGWSVQVKNATFYKKMSMKEMKEQYDDIIYTLNHDIKVLKKEKKYLLNELTKYKTK